MGIKVGFVIVVVDRFEIKIIGVGSYVVRLEKGVDLIIIVLNIVIFF